MTQDTQGEFNELFLKLSQLKDSMISHPHESFSDSFVHLCLCMAKILVQNEQFTKIIGKELCLIPNQKKPLNFLDLGHSLAVLERDLEENLRGFSSLLNLVLEDIVIRQNPLDILTKVPGIKEGIKERFHDLSNLIIAYLDLKDAFFVEAPKALTAIFLMSVGEIMDELYYQPGQGRNALTNWLKNRVKNEALGILFEQLEKKPELCEIMNLSSLYQKDLLVILLCQKMVYRPALSKDEESLLDNYLKDLGMIGLSPLVESGALSLEHGFHVHEHREKSELRIFRIV